MRGAKHNLHWTTLLLFQTLNFDKSKKEKNPSFKIWPWTMRSCHAMKEFLIKKSDIIFGQFYLLKGLHLRLCLCPPFQPLLEDSTPLGGERKDLTTKPYYHKYVNFNIFYSCFLLFLHSTFFPTILSPSFFLLQIISQIAF